MKNWGGLASGAGAAALSVLSCAVCPFCIPLYVGLLGFMGIELGDIHGVSLPLMMVFILISLGLMARQIYKHKGRWKPFFFAGAGALGMTLSVFYDQDWCLYASVALFMVSLLWTKRGVVHKGKGCC